MKLKKISILSLILSLALITTLFAGCKKDNTEALTRVRLNEVVRSIFYAPMYAAISEGFFKEEGIEIDLSTGQGADKTMQQVLSDAVDIGFCGPEQVIYIYNQHREDYPVIFAQLTQKDGSFLVSTKEEPNFNWESLKGKTVIGGRPAAGKTLIKDQIIREAFTLNKGDKFRVLEFSLEMVQRVSAIREYLRTTKYDPIIGAMRAIAIPATKARTIKSY